MAITIGSGIVVGAGISMLPSPTSGLVANYDAANYVSGTVWPDSSGNGNDLTWQNSGDISYYGSGSTAYFGTGATGYFNGAGTVVIPQGADPYTMMAWVQFPDTIGDNGLISIGGFGTTLQSNAFRTGGAFLLNYWWGNDLSVSDPALTTGTWLLATVTSDGSSRAIYHNTSLLGTDTQAGHDVVSTEIQVGKTYNIEYLKGFIAMARIYNRQLDSSEITDVYNTFAARYI